MGRKIFKNKQRLLCCLSDHVVAPCVDSNHAEVHTTKISILLTLFPLLMPASVLAGTVQYTDLGPVMAQLNNQSELAGGLGANGWELAAHYIAGQQSPGKKAEQPSRLSSLDDNREWIHEAINKT